MLPETKYKENSYTFEEYLVLEEKAPYKSEFQKGKIVAMSGGTFDHNTIAQNTGTAISNALKKKNKKCRVANSDQKVYIQDYDKAVYPDVSVYCDKPNFYNDRKDVLTNPLLIVEVLSSSTENYDRGKKFTQYRSLPSFKEYVLISQSQAKVETWYKQEENVWRISNAEGLETSIHVYSLDITIPLTDLYYLVDSFNEEEKT